MTEPVLAPYFNPRAREWTTAGTADTLSFHETLPNLTWTPLVEVPELATELGVGRVFVKVESSRMGLPSFKILGASYAITRALAARHGVSRVMPIGELRKWLDTVPPLELTAATDGNHGRAVAHVGAILGVAVRIFTPADISPEAKRAIEEEGAVRVEVAAPYDDVVAAAARDAEARGAVLIQDTAWEGYEQIPQWIVDGYSTLVIEADAQLADAGVTRLDLVAVPVGVGSLAQAAVGHYRSHPDSPSILSVEAEAAPALLTSLHAGRAVSVPTEATIMAGLNCGTPTSIGWPTLHAGVDAAVVVSDEDAARAVHDLQRLGVDAGPCGASTLAGARALASISPMAPDSTLLLLSTEGSGANPLPSRFSAAG